MKEAYVQGFMQKCAELGVDPEVLIKLAQGEPSRLGTYGLGALYPLLKAEEGKRLSEFGHGLVDSVGGGLLGGLAGGVGGGALGGLGGLGLGALVGRPGLGAKAGGGLGIFTGGSLGTYGGAGETLYRGMMNRRTRMDRIKSLLSKLIAGAGDKYDDLVG